MKKRLTSLLMVLCMALSLTTISFAADKTVSSWSELANVVRSTYGSISITLSCDITAGEGDGEIAISGTSDVRLDLNGHVLDGAGRTRVFLIEDGGRLVITDSDAQKRGAVAGGSTENASVDYSGGGVYVSEGGQLELNGATIRDCYGDDGGGAVCTLGNFYMYNGAVIKDCKTRGIGGGGAVYTAGSKAQVIMRDTSLIENCSFCGVWVEKGSFTMEGGTIKDCQARTGGGGIYISEEGTFTLSGGLITGNYAGTNKGGAIFLEGTLNLRGGEISDNKVDDMSQYLDDFIPYNGIFSRYSGVINCGGGDVKDTVYLQENARINDDSFYGTTVFYSNVLGRGDVRGGTYLGECWYQSSGTSHLVRFHGDSDDPYDFIMREEVFSGSKALEPTWLGWEWVTADGEPFDFSQPLTAGVTLYPKAAGAESGAAADAAGESDPSSAGALFDAEGNTSSAVTVLLILSLAGNAALLALLLRMKKKQA